MFRQIAFVSLLITSLPASSDVGLKDPTQPGNWQRPKPAERTKAPELQSVILGSERRVAVINGMVLAEGSEMGGIRLVAVRRNEVDVLIHGRGALVLRLGPPVIKEPNDE